MEREWARQVRRAFGLAMLRDALLLRIASHGVRMYLEGDDVNALSGRERVHIALAAEEIEAATKRLRKVGKRCTDETE